MPRAVTCNSNPFPTNTEKWRGHLVRLRDGQGFGLTGNVMMDRNGKAILWDGGKSDATVLKAPREVLIIDSNLLGQDNRHVFDFRRGMVIAGGLASGGDQEDDHIRDGVRIWQAGGGDDTVRPAFALAIDNGVPNNPALPAKPVIAGDTYGGLYRGHFWRDDFFYAPTKWISNVTGPLQYGLTSAGAGSKVYAVDGSLGGLASCGACALELGGSGGSAAIAGNAGLRVDSDKDFNWNFAARLGFMTGALTDYDVVRVGFFSAGNHNYYFEFDGVTTQQWRASFWNGAGQVFSATTPAAMALDKILYMSIHMVSATAIIFKIATKDGTIAYSTIETNGTRSGSAEHMYAAVDFVTGDANARIILDYWEWWDQDVLYHRLGNSHNQVFP
jgi:hypothetical protein